MTRPYVHVAGGLVESMSFNKDTRHFHMCLQFTDITPQVPTEVRLDSVYLYHDGHNVTTTGAIAVQTSTARKVVLTSLLTKGSGCVSITPAQ